MTTIAYKDGVIAYDSRATRSGGMISSDKAVKRLSLGSTHFFFCGSMADVEEFAGIFLAECFEINKRNQLEAFVFHDGVLWKAGADDGELWKERVYYDHDAIGSGCPYALTAMDMGADAKTAVKMAMRRDTCTGGRIRTFRL